MDAPSTTSTRPHLIDLADHGEGVTELVPLGFKNYPALASQLRHIARQLGDFVFDVPDDLCGDIDLLEMQMDIQLVAQRVEDRVNRARQ